MTNNEANDGTQKAHKGTHKAQKMNFKIRVATESDAPVLARFRYALRSSAKEMIESEADFIKRCTLWMQARLHSESTWRCWIAECEQTPVGNIWSQLVEKIPNPASETECYVY